MHNLLSSIYNHGVIGNVVLSYNELETLISFCFCRVKKLKYLSIDIILANLFESRVKLKKRKQENKIARK